jgi:hypothetical protein
MLSILFTKSTISYYLLMFLCEHLTRYGIKESCNNGRSELLTFVKLSSLCGVIFLIYYSYNTRWWAFVALLAMNVLIFVVTNELFMKRFNFLKTNGLCVNQNFRFLLIPLIFLSFYFI